MSERTYGGNAVPARNVSRKAPLAASKPKPPRLRVLDPTDGSIRYSSLALPESHREINQAIQSPLQSNTKQCSVSDTVSPLSRSISVAKAATCFLLSAQPAFSSLIHQSERKSSCSGEPLLAYLGCFD